MNNKFDLIFQADELTSANNEYTKCIYQEYFNIRSWDNSETYDKKTTVFLFYYNLPTGIKFKLIEQLLAEGYKVILDQLHDSNTIPYVSDGALRLHISEWFWINEFFINKKFGFNSYEPNKTYGKKAFMPMHRQRPERTKIFSLFKDQHFDMIYSYNRSPELPITQCGEIWDRQFNPLWYDDTYFSVVVETRLMEPPVCYEKVRFVTEKTWKPIAFSHPFIFIAEPGSLEYLKSHNFETYENMFDESYDSIEDLKTRIHNVHSQVATFKKTPYDKITQEKINYNRNLFYNEQVVSNLIKKYIINPIFEYLET